MHPTRISYFNCTHRSAIVCHYLLNCHGALSLSKDQLSDLNVCWNNLYRQLFHFHRCESVRVFINGIRKLDFLHLSKLITAKFFKQLSISSRQVFFMVIGPTVFGDRFLQLFHELNLKLNCSIAAINKAVFSHFNHMCNCM